MVDTELFRSKVKEKGVKLCYLAKGIGISKYGLYLKIINEQQFKADEITGLCDLLGIDDLTEKESIFFARDVAEKGTDNG